MNKRGYILVLFLLVLTYTVKAQQDPMYTQYMNQLLSINPAYAGAKGVTSATVIAREMWTGIEGHPSTQTVFAHSPMNDEMGVGGSLIHDVVGKNGLVSSTALFGDYSYTITYPGERYMAFGLKAGVRLYQSLLSQVNLGNGELIDPAFQGDIVSRLLPNAGVGVYFSSPDYYFGLSVPGLIANKIMEEDYETGAASREQLHMYMMGGYVFDINRILKFKPYFMLRVTPNAPLSIDLTGQIVFIEKFWLGATYRFGNSIGAMTQVQVNDQLRFGYAYDIATNGIGGGQYNTGTHEIMLTFDFSFGRGRVRSPRYF